MLLIFTLYSFNLTNSSVVPNFDSYKRTYYEYKILTNLNFLTDNANSELNSNLKYEKLPLGIPLNIDSVHITSKYGERKPHPITGRHSFHRGIDIAANKGTKVHSILKGKVLRRQYHFMGYGKIVKIEHFDGITTIYAHLDKTFVERGDSVNVGDIIGTVGNTGLSTGNHLHYEIRKNGIATNPLSLYLPNKEIKFRNLKTINNFLKLSKMKTKEITKTLSLEELKDLKDKTVKSINAIQYSLKNGHVKKETSFENALENIEMKQENLVRIKNLLAKANSLEFNIPDSQEDTSNNENIFKLALYRDYKKTLIESSKEGFSERKKQKKEEITKRIEKIDSEIKEFNKNTKVEITLLDKDL